MIITARAYAKINLTLDVLGKREDGYHDLLMVTHSVSLCDDLTIALTGEEGVAVRCGTRYVPEDGRNLAAKAVTLLLAHPAARESGVNGCHIEIVKRIPVCAGLGGGSSDAAAALAAVNAALGHPAGTPELLEMAEAVGSDVPFCLLGGSHLVEGRGEVLTPLPALPPCHILIIKPPVPLSTASVFGLYSESRRGARRRPDTGGVIEALQNADLTGVARRVFNVLQEPAARRVREISEIQARLIGAGALGASMSGAGSAVFGVFGDEHSARQAAAEFGPPHDVFVTTPKTSPNI